MTVKLTNTEKRIITAMYKLNRFANANEISKVAVVSWPTTKKALEILYSKRKILNKKDIKDKEYFMIKDSLN